MIFLLISNAAKNLFTFACRCDISASSQTCFLILATWEVWLRFFRSVTGKITLSTCWKPHKSYVSHTFFVVSPRFLGLLYCREKKLFVRVFESCWTLTDEKKLLEASLGAHSCCRQKEPCSLPRTESCSEGRPTIS